MKSFNLRLIFVRHFACPRSKQLSITSISPFCTDLGLINMLLTNQNAEIVACMLLVEKFRAKRCHGNFAISHV